MLQDFNIKWGNNKVQYGGLEEIISDEFYCFLGFLAEAKYMIEPRFMSLPIDGNLLKINKLQGGTQKSRYEQGYNLLSVNSLKGEDYIEVWCKALYAYACKENIPLNFLSNKPVVNDNFMEDSVKGLKTRVMAEIYKTLPLYTDVSLGMYEFIEGNNLYVPDIVENNLYMLNIRTKYAYGEFCKNMTVQTFTEYDAEIRKLYEEDYDTSQIIHLLGMLENARMGEFDRSSLSSLTFLEGVMDREKFIHIVMMSYLNYKESNGKEYLGYYIRRNFGDDVDINNVVDRITFNNQIVLETLQAIYRSYVMKNNSTFIIDKTRVISILTANSVQYKGMKDGELSFVREGTKLSVDVPEEYKVNKGSITTKVYLSKEVVKEEYLWDGLFDYEDFAKFILDLDLTLVMTEEDFKVEIDTDNAVSSEGSLFDTMEVDNSKNITYSEIEKPVFEPTVYKKIVPYSSDTLIQELKSYNLVFSDTKKEKGKVKSILQGISEILLIQDETENSILLYDTNTGVKIYQSECSKKTYKTVAKRVANAMKKYILNNTVEDCSNKQMKEQISDEHSNNDSKCKVESSNIYENNENRDDYTLGLRRAVSDTIIAYNLNPDKLSYNEQIFENIFVQIMNSKGKNLIYTYKNPYASRAKKEQILTPYTVKNTKTEAYVIFTKGVKFDNRKPESTISGFAYNYYKGTGTKNLEVFYVQTLTYMLARTFGITLSKGYFEPGVFKQIHKEGIINVYFDYLRVLNSLVDAQG